MCYACTLLVRYIFSLYGLYKKVLAIRLLFVNISNNLKFFKRIFLNQKKDL